MEAGILTQFVNLDLDMNVSGSNELGLQYIDRVHRQRLQHDCVDFGGEWYQYSIVGGLIRPHMPSVK